MVPSWKRVIGLTIARRNPRTYHSDRAFRLDGRSEIDDSGWEQSSNNDEQDATRQNPALTGQGIRNHGEAGLMFA